MNLTVRDPATSALWYSELLGLQVLYDYAGEDGRLHYVALVDPESQLVLALVGHQEHSGEQFSEFRTGLDHLEFLVNRREDLNDWAERLNGLGIRTQESRSPGTPGTPWSPSVTPTTSSSNSSGGRQPDRSHTEPATGIPRYGLELVNA